MKALRLYIYIHTSILQEKNLVKSVSEASVINNINKELKQESYI